MAQLRLAAALLAVAFSAVLAVGASSVPVRGVVDANHAMLARKEAGTEGAWRSVLRRIRSKALAASGTARLQKWSRLRKGRRGKNRAGEWQGWLKRTLHDNEIHTHGNYVSHMHRRQAEASSSFSSSTPDTALDESCSYSYGSGSGSAYGSAYGSGSQQRGGDECEGHRYNEQQDSRCI